MAFIGHGNPRTLQPGCLRNPRRRSNPVLQLSSVATKTFAQTDLLVLRKQRQGLIVRIVHQLLDPAKPIYQQQLGKPELPGPDRRESRSKRFATGSYQWRPSRRRAYKVLHCVQKLAVLVQWRELQGFLPDEKHAGQAIG